MTKKTKKSAKNGEKSDKENNKLTDEDYKKIMKDYDNAKEAGILAEGEKEEEEEEDEEEEEEEEDNNGKKTKGESDNDYQEEKGANDDEKKADVDGIESMKGDPFKGFNTSLNGNQRPMAASSTVTSTTPSPIFALTSTKSRNDDAKESSSDCDDECLSFRESLRSWPSNKPKAVIFYLVHRSALKSLSRSIAALDRHFRRRFLYPLVIFIEPDLDNEADRNHIRSMSKNPGDHLMPVYIQVVRFSIPPYVNASAVPPLAGFGRRKRTIGYRHMCRFHAFGVYQQPIMLSQDLEFGWRLDDDSTLLAPVEYDLFQFMRDRKLQYGYKKINTGWSPVDHELWTAVDRYVNASGGALRTPYYDKWPKNSARFFNNFEISDLTVWRSKPYRDYFDFVDRLGGIYYYKWGDAAIKTIAVTLFIPEEKTHKFSKVKYVHN
jgi:alpha 1,2-mannosyltransferase